MMEGYSMKPYVIGVDYGTNSVRAIVVDARNGEVQGTTVYAYTRGENGIVISNSDPDVARQHPADYLQGVERVVRGALTESGVDPQQVAGIGVDATGSTPMPVDEQGVPLALNPEFADQPDAMAWLWKDHTAHAEATEITQRAQALRPHYLDTCGGAYSSEWFWSKILHCARTAPEVYAAAYTWVELSDWIPAVLSGTQQPDRLQRSLCAAGHKGLFSPEWGGYPEAEFIASFDQGVLTRIRKTLPAEAYHIGHSVGGLDPEWAAKWGLPVGIPVAAGIIDAHAGAVGSGVKPGVMVKIIGTSTCDIVLAPLDQPRPMVPGICGVAQESVLPGSYGLEAGQSAVGDIFNWYVNKLLAGTQLTHEDLEREAARLEPGECGLISLDWHNGNRSLLTDPQLSGMLVGLNLHTSPSDIYRALVEGTAFGARMIIERFKEYGVAVDRVINCGGISIKSPLTMQIYADILGCPMEVSANQESCALGAAMAGAVVGHVHPDFASATAAMTQVRAQSYQPHAERHAQYNRLYALYVQLHDLFGRHKGQQVPSAFNVMKDLMALRSQN